MKVLVVGSGAREHALAWRVSESTLVDEVLCAPGNAGTGDVARNVPVQADDLVGLVELAVREGVELVIVGPEAPLVAGLTDLLAEKKIPAFGPSAAAAELEGSKAFSKEFMARHGIPTARFAVFDDVDLAVQHVRGLASPPVVKADGLAAGKGVVVASSLAEAERAVLAMMRDRLFGDAGARVVIEERIAGEEVSYHVVSDGERYVALAAAQDHKRLGDGDQGPNTGGMGAYSPVPLFTAELERRVLAEVVEPTLRGLASEGRPFRGALFCGLMIHQGDVQVLEYNVRFGDPECEVLMARYAGDLVPLLLGAARGDLSDVEPSFGAGAAIAVVHAAAGYPTRPRKGTPIHGLDLPLAEGVRVFHAGTQREADRIVTSGGRVLTVTASGATVDEAAARAYAASELVTFEGRQMRRDIGWRARRVL